MTVPAVPNFVRSLCALFTRVRRADVDSRAQTESLHPCSGPSRSPCSGISLTEVAVAMALSLVALLAVAPAIVLSLRILVLGQTELDQEVAVDSAWDEIYENPGPPPDIAITRDVGAGRQLRVDAHSIETDSSLTRWRLWVDGSDYSQERWRSK